MKRALTAAVLVAGCSACAYFNALYNAERLFEEAGRAAARGEADAARQAYAEAIRKAAKGLRQAPDGRWADNALYLIGRAHLANGDDRAAAAALERAIRRTDDPAIRAGAHAHLGAARVGLAAYPAALRDLDAALTDGAAPADVRAFARLWRARARFAIGEDSAAWADLDTAALAPDGGTVAREARLVWLRLAVSTDSRDRAVTAAAALLGDPQGHRWADSLLTWVERARDRWGARDARDLLAAAGAAAWPADARDRLVLRRARLAAEAGDTTRAIDEARDLAARAAGSTAARARVLWARWRLARADEPADLSAVRDLLLPVVGDPDAQALLRSLRVTTTLIARAEGGGEPLAWFAAAERARDDLAAPRVARVLFVRYADAAPTSVWAPKALLAAAALAETPAQAGRIRARLNVRYRGSVYVAPAAGAGPRRAFTDAEQRLDGALAALSDDARRVAERSDVMVMQAVVAADSAGADSLRASCGTALDTLALDGVRADSLRTACMRRDSARVDTLDDADTVGARAPRGPAGAWPPSAAPGASIVLRERR